jgi:hypothetical protein
VPDAIECWNEPDLSAFQRGFMDGSAQVYFNALKVVHDEMITAGIWGKIPLVAGAVSNVAPQNPGGKLMAAIQQLGSDGYCNVYSYHSYAGTVHDIIGSYDAGAAYRKIKALYGLNKPLWITEMGDGAINPPYMQNWFAELRNVCPFVCWYHFSGSSTDDHAMVVRTGTNAYTVRPQYTIFQSFV